MNPISLTAEQFIFVVLSVSFSLNVVFMRRLLAKIDRQSDALYNTTDGVFIRLDRLEHTAERRLLASQITGART